MLVLPDELAIEVDMDRCIKTIRIHNSFGKVISDQSFKAAECKSKYFFTRVNQTWSHADIVTISKELSNEKSITFDYSLQFSALGCSDTSRIFSNLLLP
jgi:hypothetical protein